VILSTGAAVLRHGFEAVFTEQHEISADAVDLSRLPVPVLDGHRQDGVASILGTLESASIEGGVLVGTVKISARHELLIDDIEAGVIRSVSIGNTVAEYADQPGPNGQKTRTATRWTLVEASFVSVPADPQATVRSQDMTTQTTAAPPPASTTAPAQVATITRADANAEIPALATTLGLPHDFANGLIDREATVDQARAEAIAQVQTRATTTGPRVTAMHQIDSPAALVTRMGEAVYARANPGHTPSDAARPYMGLTTLDMARDCLTRAGGSITGLSQADVITRALHTTSDFPLIFGDTVGRSLRAGYDAAPDTLKKVGRRTTARDFRAKTSIRLPSAARWYVAADPAQVEGLEYAYLQGEEGPQVETKAGFEVDGMQFKVRLDFGAAFLDCRSWYMNPGA